MMQVFGASTGDGLGVPRAVWLESRSKGRHRPEWGTRTMLKRRLYRGRERARAQDVAELGALVLVAALFVALAVLAPIAQPQQYHRLADMRALALGAFLLPNAADGPTSLPFTLVGRV